MKHWLTVLMLLMAMRASAVVEYHPFDDPQQEESYQTLIDELRCLVCQNQTIADSNADLAKDLRNQVYSMLQQGKSKQDVIDFMTQRYGDFVLYRPAFNVKTGLLWLGPLLFLLVGISAIVVLVRRKRHGPDAPVLEVKRQRELDAILHSEEED